MAFKFNPFTGLLDTVNSIDFSTDTLHVLKAGDTMTGALVLNQSNSGGQGIEVNLNESTGAQPAAYIHNNTSWAVINPLVKLELKNGSDTGAVLSLINAGTGNYVTAGTAFTVDKSGNITTTGGLKLSTDLTIAYSSSPSVLTGIGQVTTAKTRVSQDAMLYFDNTSATNQFQASAIRIKTGASTVDTTLGIHGINTGTGDFQYVDVQAANGTGIAVDGGSSATSAIAYQSAIKGTTQTGMKLFNTSTAVDGQMMWIQQIAVSGSPAPACIKLESFAGDPIYKIFVRTGGNSKFQYLYYDVANQPFFNTNMSASDTFQFTYGSSVLTEFNVLTLKSTGRVGINMSNPLYNLHVQNATADSEIRSESITTSDTRGRVTALGTNVNGRGQITISGAHSGFDGTQNGDGPAILEMIGDNGNTNPTKFAFTVAASAKLLKLDVTNNGSGGTITGMAKFYAAGGMQTTTGRAVSVVAKSSAYGVARADEVILVTTAATTGMAITLPAANDLLGRMITVKKVDSGAGTVAVTRAGSDTIEGATTKTLTAQYSSVTLVSDGTATWYVRSTT